MDRLRVTNVADDSRLTIRKERFVDSCEYCGEPIALGQRVLVPDEWGAIHALHAGICEERWKEREWYFQEVEEEEEDLSYLAEFMDDEEGVGEFDEGEDW